MLPSSGSKTKPSKKPTRSSQERELFNPEEGGSTFLRNVGDLYRTIRRYIPGESTAHSLRCENLKSNKYEEVENGVSITEIVTRLDHLWISKQCAMNILHLFNIESSKIRNLITWDIRIFHTPVVSWSQIKNGKLIREKKKSLIRIDKLLPSCGYGA
jgi:hypothetical protein